jgi:hypothetical protein
MSATTKYILLLATMLASVTLPALAQAAGNQGSAITIKCWKNDLGIRECGNIVPPEYSQKRIEVLNAQGQLVKIIQPAKSRAQLQREHELEQKRKAAEAAKKRQEHADSILLNSYATERDLIMARDTNVKALQADIDITEGNLKMLRTNLENLQTHAGNYERSGKEPPKELVAQIDKTKLQIANKQKSVDRKKQNKAAMEKRFARELARFRQLKGLSH